MKFYTFFLSISLIFNLCLLSASLPQDVPYENTMIPDELSKGSEGSSALHFNVMFPDGHLISKAYRIYDFDMKLKNYSTALKNNLRLYKPSRDKDVEKVILFYQDGVPVNTELTLRDLYKEYFEKNKPTTIVSLNDFYRNFEGLKAKVEYKNVTPIAPLAVPAAPIAVPAGIVPVPTVIPATIPLFVNLQYGKEKYRTSIDLIGIKTIGQLKKVLADELGVTTDKIGIIIRRELKGGKFKKNALRDQDVTDRMLKADKVVVELLADVNPDVVKKVFPKYI